MWRMTQQAIFVRPYISVLTSRVAMEETRVQAGERGHR
jgi:hypothetical protein